MCPYVCGAPCPPVTFVSQRRALALPLHSCLSLSRGAMGQWSDACMIPGVNGGAVHTRAHGRRWSTTQRGRGAPTRVRRVGLVSPKDARGIALTCRPVPACPFACRMSWLSPGQASGTLLSRVPNVRRLRGALACCRSCTPHIHTVAQLLRSASASEPR